MQDYWHRQTVDKPLFPDLLWSRPENRSSAGKLLIIGGHAQGFAAPAEAYSETVKAGIGSARVLLPDAIQKAIRQFMSEGEFAPSTPSGSFSQKALAVFLEHSARTDASLLAGDLGRNSETGIVIEKFLQKNPLPITITKDAADYAVLLPETVLNRPNTLLVITMAQLQKLCTAIKFPTAITFGMDLTRLVEVLHDFTLKHSTTIMVKHLSVIVCAVDGQVSTTTLLIDPDTWRIKTAAYATIWWLQNPTKLFEAITTAVYELNAT